MDILSILGLVIGIGGIVLGNALEGGHLSSILQLTAFLIVVGGSVGAIMLHTPLDIFLHALRSATKVFFPPRLDGKGAIEKIVNWSQIARKEGLLGLEPLVEAESDPYTRKALQLLVDGTEPETIRAILEVELEARETRDMAAAKVFESMGGYSPTIGILGAVLGLIHVMENLSDPSKLGAGIAVAFVATIYGVGLANLILIPIGNKLKTHAHRETQLRAMIIEGLVSISHGENPRHIETKLQGYL